MDPSIMKLLEEDEDETMHSGADVDAFTAALNRDIEGHAPASQPSDSKNSPLFQGSSYTSDQFLSQCKTSVHNENVNTRSQQDAVVVLQNEPQSVEMDSKQHGSVLKNQQQPVDSFTSQADQNLLNVTVQDSENIQVRNQGPDKMQNLDHDPEHAKLQSTNSQQPSMMGPRSQQAVAMGTNNQQAVAPGVSNQSAMATGSSSQQASNANRGKQVPFALLLPVILSQLDKDRAMQLNTLYLKLRKNEISKDVFLQHMRSIVGDQMLKMAIYKMPQVPKNSQNVPSQLPVQSQASSQQQQLPTPSTVQKVTDSSNQTTDGDSPTSREVEHHSDSRGMETNQMSTSSLIPKNQGRDHSSFPLQGINKQQHMPFSQASFPAFGSTGSNYPHSAMNTNSAAVTVKQQPHDLQMRQIPTHQSIGTAPLGMNAVSMPKFEQKRLHGAAHSHMTNGSGLPQKSGVSSSMTYINQEPNDQSNEQHKQFPAPHGSSFSVHPEHGNALPETLKDESFEMQSSTVGFAMLANTVPSNSLSSSISTKTVSNISLNSRIPPANSPIAVGNNAKVPPKKSSVGQKKPMETLGSPPPSSKKQKVSGAFQDQSIEQLNDVTAVSGVNLREEEEQLFSGPKEDSRVSEASRRVVQEEEERLILEKIPLQQKLAEIMAKSGLKNISNDVERCLSLCVEERMRGLIWNLIRLSKQRVDIEKSRHKTRITSDVRQQIMSMNQKARQELEKKQAEAEKLQRLNEPEGNPEVDGEKDKDESRGKALKANKEEDDKMRTTAANVAARAAVGVDDMLSKWQLMAEQNKQKRVGGIDADSGSQPRRDAGQKLSSARRDNQEADKRAQSASTSTPGAVRKVGRNQVIEVARNISVKDVIAVLEREPQMSKSTLMYRLYDKVRNDAAAE